MTSTSVSMTFLTIAASSICSASLSFADDVKSSHLVLGSPSLVTCPTANCPAPPKLPVLSTQFIHGKTTKGADQHEWLSNLGLLVDTGAPNGQKVTQYLGVLQAPGAGTVWALNTDTVRNGLPGGKNSFGGFEGSGQPGVPGSIGDRNGTIGYELDFTNWDSNSAPGVGAFTVGQYIHAQGSFTSLSAVYLDARMKLGNHAWHNGIHFNGSMLVKENTIYDGTSSRVSVNVAGNHRVGINTSLGNSDMVSLAAKSGQSICLNNTKNCLSIYKDRLVYTNSSGKKVFSVDNEGNMRISGRLLNEDPAIGAQ